MESQQPIVPNALPAIPGGESTLELVHLFDKLQAIRAFMLDVDGVMTNNTVHVTESGDQLRTMSIRDGLGLKIALQKGFSVCIITGGRSQGVIKRLGGLGIEHIYSGIEDKWPVFLQFLQLHGLKPHEICYMGDDLPDLQILRKVGLSTCPADAVPEVINLVDYISPLAGGTGCVRDIVEKVLKAQGKWKFEV